MRRAALACLFLVPLAACQPTLLSAHNSVNPVLVGPVKAIRNADVPLERVGAFSTETLAMTSGSGDGSGSSSGSSHRTGATEADWAIVGATSGDPRRTVRLESVSCGGWAFFAIAGLVSWVTCEAKGSVFDPPAGVTTIELARRRDQRAAAARRAAASTTAPPIAGATDDAAPAAASGSAGGLVEAVAAPPAPPEAAPPRRTRPRSNVVPPPPPPILQ